MDNQKKAARIASTGARIVVGSVIYAAGFVFFMYPNSIVAGGVTGIAMIINLLTGFPIGVLIIVINVPLFFIAWRAFGLRFIMLSLIGMLVSSVMVDTVSLLGVNITSDPLLASIYGGLLMGAGLGIVYTTGATTGGIDIAAKLLRVRYPHVNYGSMILMLDVIVIVSFMLIFKRYDTCMYALISIFLVSQVVDFFLYGAVSAKLCYVVTEKSGMIKDAIGDELNRGATLFRGEGAHTGKEKDVIMCVLKRQQIVELRRIVYRYDEDAFMIVSDAREVFGNGFVGFDADGQ